MSIDNKFTELARGLRLSEKLLILTVLFVMLAEILIFLPSIGNFRRNWLAERLNAAQIAALAVEAAPNNMVPEKLRKELLSRAQVYSVALKQGNERHLILQSPMPAVFARYYDLRDQNYYSLIRDAIYVFFQPKDTMIRVVGKPDMSEAEFIEVLMTQGQLKTAMVKFSLNILWLSILISIISAALVYLSINRLLVRPIARITQNMTAFAENPEDIDRKIIPSGRRDEIGTIENELLTMQTDLSTMLLQKTRLANLGAAVSKINHDLRNMLSTAQLVSDRLTGVDDPVVQNVTPRLVRAIDRAIKLCSQTLQYGKPEEQGPNRTQLPLLPLIEEVCEELGLPKAELQTEIKIENGLAVFGDKDLLYRVFSNIIRNSAQAIDATDGSSSEFINIKASQTAKETIIDIIDSGPGLPKKARTYLFEAFKGSTRKGGTGLGLAIAAEIIHAHNGEIDCLETSTGAHFQIKLPRNGHCPD